MSFAPVKSDPWKAKKSTKKKNPWWLWPDGFWKRICDLDESWAIANGKFEGVGPLAFEAIREMNETIHGS